MLAGNKFALPQMATRGHHASGGRFQGTTVSGERPCKALSALLTYVTTHRGTLVNTFSVSRAPQSCQMDCLLILKQRAIPFSESTVVALFEPLEFH
jgi:hypothetical protein